MPERAYDSDYVVQLLDETRDEVTRADQKAGVVLFVLGIGLGALLAGLIRGDWTPIDRGGVTAGMWWLGSIVLLGAVVSAALAVWPRFRASKSSDQITFWGDAGRTSSPEDLAARLDTQELDTGERRVEELWHLSRIVMQKYRFIRAGLLLAGVGFALHTIGAVLVYFG